MKDGQPINIRGAQRAPRGRRAAVLARPGRRAALWALNASRRGRALASTKMSRDASTLRGLRRLALADQSGNWTTPHLADWAGAVRHGFGGFPAWHLTKANMTRGRTTTLSGFVDKFGSSIAAALSDRRRSNRRTDPMVQLENEFGDYGELHRRSNEDAAQTGARRTLRRRTSARPSHTRRCRQ